MTSAALFATRLRRREQDEEGKQKGQILPSVEVIMQNEMTICAAAATRLRRREQVQEGKEYGQILPTAEVIMKKRK